jgi:hypothetical protein
MLFGIIEFGAFCLFIRGIGRQNDSAALFNDELRVHLLASDLVGFARRPMDDDRIHR